jgi:Zn-dependent peptidase ImmA (M78 family)
LRWNIAHELGHLVMHRNVDGTTKEREDQADLFASELLLPTPMLVEMKPPLTLTRFAEITARWGVSIQAAVNSAWQLDIITDRQRKYLFMQLSSLGWRKDEPVAIQLERPRLLRKNGRVDFWRSSRLRTASATGGSPSETGSEHLGTALDVRATARRCANASQRAARFSAEEALR